MKRGMFLGVITVCFSLGMGLWDSAFAYEKVMSVAEKLSRRAENLGQLQLRAEGCDTFVRVSLDKTRAYPGEMIQMTFDLLSREDAKFRGFETAYKAPGFYAEAFSADHFVSKIRQTTLYQNKQYTRDTIAKILLYADQHGFHEVETGTVRVRIPHKGKDAHDVVLTQARRAFRVEILELPETKRPVDFSHLVGQYSSKSWLDVESLDAGREVKWVYQISGNGHLRQFSFPLSDFPDGLKVVGVEERMEYAFPQGNPKITKTFEILMRPDAGIRGGFWIPQIHVSYFDPSRNMHRYESTSTPSVLVYPQGEVLDSEENPVISGDEADEPADSKEVS